MADLDLVLTAPRAVVDGAEVGCAVGVAGGRIVAVEALASGLRGRRDVTLADDEVLLPGLVDTHVHVNDPGRADWEGFASATRAAARGGVTTIVDMPLNSIPATVDVAALTMKQQAAAGSCYVDVGFWGGVVPRNRPDLEALWDSGVLGFKCFLVDSGVPEFPALTEADLLATMQRVASFGGLLLVHAESADDVRDPVASSTSYADFLASRPDQAEVWAVRCVVEAARRTGCRVHVVHLSSAAAVPVVAAARADGVPVTAETCPHYLIFAAEEIDDGATVFKCCPPIRAAGNRELLWDGLAAGVVECVVTDHSPCTADLKRLDTGCFDQAWGGISSLQVGLPAVWTEARRRGHPLSDVVGWMASAPADRAGLRHKGRIAVGAAADLCVFAPEKSFTVDPDRLEHRNKLTPYACRELVGTVRTSWLAGEPVDLDQPPRGRLLHRGEA